MAYLVAPAPAEPPAAVATEYADEAALAMLVASEAPKAVTDCAGGQADEVLTKAINVGGTLRAGEKWNVRQSRRRPRQWQSRRRLSRHDI